MDDLVKRLQSKTPNMAAGHKAMEEAANEITALCARLAEVEAALATARRDALEDLVAIVRRDEQAGDISSGAAQWFADSASTLIAQEQDITGGRKDG